MVVIVCTHRLEQKKGVHGQGWGLFLKLCTRQSDQPYVHFLESRPFLVSVMESKVKVVLAAVDSAASSESHAFVDWLRDRQGVYSDTCHPPSQVRRRRAARRCIRSCAGWLLLSSRVLSVYLIVKLRLPATEQTVPLLKPWCCRRRSSPR